MSILQTMSDESQNFQNRVKYAVLDYCAKQNRPKRKNDSPERRVNLELRDWFIDHGWYMQRFESKAKKINGVWRTAGLKEGTPDWGGTCSKGHSAWVESKAPGRLSTLREEQRNFLLRVIGNYGFGIVSDSAKRVEEIYTKWLSLDREDGRTYLLSELPRRVRSNSKF